MTETGRRGGGYRPADPTRFITQLGELDRSKSEREKFRDFIELVYCAYAKLTAPDDERAEALEARYMGIVETYRDKDAVRAYPRFLATAALEAARGRDFLGEVAAELGLLDARAGQFFTPSSVCRLMAEITMGDPGPLIEAEGFMTLVEPAVGGGGMVLAAADVLERGGYEPGRHMLVNAVDVSPLCYQMCFLQLTWRGVPALVERANSLSLERFEASWTPATGAFYAEHGRLFPEGQKPAADVPAPPRPSVQLDLFGEGQS